MAGERLGAAQADRQLGDLERVEEAERLGLAALQVEREGRSRARAMAAEDVGLGRSVLKEAEIADMIDLGMVLQIGADLRRILARAAHAQFQGFEAA